MTIKIGFNSPGGIWASATSLYCDKDGTVTVTIKVKPR